MSRNTFLVMFAVWFAWNVVCAIRGPWPVLHGIAAGVMLAMLIYGLLDRKWLR